VKGGKGEVEGECEKQLRKSVHPPRPLADPPGGRVTSPSLWEGLAKRGEGRTQSAARLKEVVPGEPVTKPELFPDVETRRYWQGKQQSAKL